jgi:hypothetical protein
MCETYQRIEDTDEVIALESATIPRPKDHR